jgi:hypothetical protein
MHDSIDYIQRLKTLPTEAAPPYNWQEFQRRAARVRPATDWRPLAVAAGLLLFVCAIAVWARFDGGGRHLVVDSNAVEAGVKVWGPDAATNALTTAPKAGSFAENSDGDQYPQTSTAIANRSRAIESWLATLPREPAVVRVGTRAAVAGLEDRIAQVDDLMTSMRLNGATPPDRVTALQRERLRLVGSLAQVRYAEVVAAQSP